MDTLPFLKRCLRFNRDHDGLDELSRNPNRLNSHVLYKDGDKFYSMVISTELQTQLFKEFDAGLTVRDMFIDMLENKDAQVNTEKIEVLDPERMYQDMNGKVMVTDLE